MSVHRAAYEGALLFGGRWLELHETDVEPKGYEGRYLLGLSGDRTRVLDFDVNNFGSARYESAGWAGNQLVLVSVDGGGYAQAATENRFVYETTDANTFGVNWQVKGTAGWPSRGDHLVCRRTAA